MSPPLALITGCSSGIGHALAIEFARRDIQVIATARKVESLRGLEAQHPNITALPLDVCDQESIEKLHARVRSLANGKLDYLINNAGIHYAMPAIELEIDRVRALFETNVFAVMQLCSVFSDLLIAGKGTIVQVGSVTRAVPVVWQSSYNASKAALSQYSKTLRLEVEPFGVKVCEIVTGYVQSQILRDGLHNRPDSLYVPIKAHVSELKTRGNRKGMPADQYSRRLADHVIRGNPSHEVWEGGQAQLLKWITTWLPEWLSYKIWFTMFKLALLRK